MRLKGWGGCLGFWVRVRLKGWGGGLGLGLGFTTFHTGPTSLVKQTPNVLVA